MAIVLQTELEEWEEPLLDELTSYFDDIPHDIDDDTIDVHLRKMYHSILVHSFDVDPASRYYVETLKIVICTRVSPLIRKRWTSRIDQLVYNDSIRAYEDYEMDGSMSYTCIKDGERCVKYTWCGSSDDIDRDPMFRRLCDAYSVDYRNDAVEIIREKRKNIYGKFLYAVLCKQESVYTKPITVHQAAVFEYEDRYVEYIDAEIVRVVHKTMFDKVDAFQSLHEEMKYSIDVPTWYQNAAREAKSSFESRIK